MAKPNPIPTDLTTQEIEKFWAGIDRKSTDECWPWKRACTGRGYGTFIIREKHHLAHRVACFLGKGIDPAEKLGCHKCDNPPCCNPAHIFIGTPKENMEDRDKKGRTAKGARHFSQTHPERLARGDRNGSRLHPDRLKRGSASSNAKLTESDVVEIHRLLAAGYSQTDIGRRFGVTQVIISAIKIGRIWVHVVPDVEYDRSSAIGRQKCLHLPPETDE